MNLVFLGTDTEVGKTYLACSLARELTQRGSTVGVYKPVASGVSPSEAGDAEQLRAAAQFHGPVEMVCPQSFRTPVAPPIAASIEGTTVDERQLVRGIEAWSAADCLVVETAGGVLSPVSENWTSADLAKQFGFPVVLIVPNRLGMVNQTLMAVEVIRNRNLNLTGVWVNSWPMDASDSSTETNLKLLRQFCAERIFTSEAELADLFSNT